MENRLNFEKLNTDVGTKRLRQAQITELIDYEAYQHTYYLCNTDYSSYL